MPHAESYFEVTVDLVHEAAWAGQPLTFRVHVKNLNPEREGPFAATHKMFDEYGGETPQAQSGEAQGLDSNETWTSGDLVLTPQRSGAHIIEVELYQDGQRTGFASHKFDVLGS